MAHTLFLVVRIALPILHASSCLECTISLVFQAFVEMTRLGQVLFMYVGVVVKTISSLLMLLTQHQRLLLIIRKKPIERLLTMRRVDRRSHRDSPAAPMMMMTTTKL